MDNLNLDVFDYKGLLERFMDEKEIVDEAVLVFVKKLTPQLEKIEVAIKENNLNDVRFETHSIKGGAANLLAKKLSEKAFNLETASKNSASTNLNNLFTELKEASEIFKKELVNNGYQF